MLGQIGGQGGQYGASSSDVQQTFFDGDTAAGGDASIVTGLVSSPDAWIHLAKFV